jgi:xylulokinase
MPPYLVGIDIGTSSTKSVLIDRDGRVLASAGKEYPLASPQPGWAEQNPADWLNAALTTVRRVVVESGVHPEEIAGIGLAGQMHSLVCLDERGQALRPAILWADRRTGVEVSLLEREIGLHHLAEWTGNPAAAGFMLPSWLWLRANEPEIAAGTRMLLLPKDEVRYRLTGELGTEASDASSTLLFDPHTLCWRTEILEMAGLSPDRLPNVFPSASVAGGLLPEMAAACGLPAGTPVVYGGSDQSMAALGQGVIEPGTVLCTIGTGGQLFVPLASPVHDPLLRLHLFCHAPVGRWHLLGAILSAGLSLRWVRDQLWPGSDYDLLTALASPAAAAEEGLFFLPHLAGERTPHMDSKVRAAFVGLDLRHGQANIVRAVMEGVVFALRQGLDLIQSLDVPEGKLITAGGSTRSPLWVRLQADIFNRPIYTSATVESTALGAALLAGIGAGVYSDFEDAIRQGIVPAQGPYLPDPTRAAMYADAFERYKRLYPALQSAGFAKEE